MSSCCNFPVLVFRLWLSNYVIDETTEVTSPHLETFSSTVSLFQCFPLLIWIIGVFSPSFESGVLIYRSKMVFFWKCREKQENKNVPAIEIFKSAPNQRFYFSLFHSWLNFFFFYYLGLNAVFNFIQLVKWKYSVLKFL